MVWSTIAAGIGLYGAGQQAKAQKRQADAIVEAARIESETLTRLAAPWTGMAERTIPTLESAIQNLMGMTAGKESPVLKAGHERTMAGIEREGERGLAKTKLWWGGTGRGRGAELRIGQQAEEAKGRERLGYGTEQEAFKRGTIGDYVGAMTNLAGMGAQGLQPAMAGAQALGRGMTGAASLRSGATQGFWGDVGGLAGTLWGQEETRREADKYRELLEKLYRGGRKKLPWDKVTENPLGY